MPDDAANGPESAEHGDMGYWDWQPLGTVAPNECGPLPPRRDLGAGGSLQQDARRSQELRQSLPRQARWTLTASAAGAALLGVILTVVAPSGGVVVLGIVLCIMSLTAGVVLYYLWRRATAAEAHLRARARAEHRTARTLDILTPSGWVILHDRVLPGGSHRVAHLAIGPSGVFVINPLPDTGTLTLTGDAGTDATGGHYDNRQLYAGPLHLGTYLATRSWEVDQLQPGLSDHLLDMAWTGPTTALAVHVPPRAWNLRHRDRRQATVPIDGWDDVTLLALSALPAFLRELPSTLSRHSVATVAAAVEHLCPPAGLADTEAQSNNDN